MTSVVDHVIVCVRDLEGSVAVFEQAHGVRSVPGGRHHGHGTANRLVPLGANYIELVAVVDPDEAVTSPFGAWVSDRSVQPGADGIAIRTEHLDTVCRRLRLEPLSMSRKAEDGEELRWRIAGIEELVSSGLPFFIQWDIDPHLHPGRISVSHPGGNLALADVVLSGDESRLQEWVGETEGVHMQAGDPSVRFDLKTV